MTPGIVLVSALLVAAFSLSLVLAFASLAPWAPTRRRDLERINRLAALRPGEVFLEVGCGTASVASYIARHNPRARVVGIEMALPLYLLAKARSILKAPGNLSVEFGDALLCDYRGADVVYVFGLPRTVNGKLKDKLEKELRPGGRFISYVFEIRDWGGSEVIKDKPDENDLSLYLGVVPGGSNQ